MSRIICVSNRVSLPDPKTGEIKAGGLAVGVRAALESHGGCVWFGWDGTIKKKSDPVGSLPGRTYSNGITFLTISLSESDYDDYYRKMSNGTLWPFMHGLGDHIEENERAFETYKEVNALFARRLRPYIKPDDVIWVHDYHLIPLGRALRELGVRNLILFFNHIPLPSCGFVYSSAVPHSLRRQYRELVQDLFYYDQVGFQSYRDFTNFTRYFNLHPEIPPRFSTTVLTNGSRQVRFGVFPISIETLQLERKARMAAHSPIVENIRESVGSCKFAIGAERLDYTKGLHHKIEGLSSLFSLFPEYKGHVKYLQIAPLSRDDVAEYKATIALTREAVKEIREQYGNESWQPVYYSEKNIPRDDLFGCFREADIGLVTPLIDGQNLVAKEYLAAQDPEDPGVLVLSKYAGAAEELGELGVILVDPYDPDHIAAKTHRAIEMSREERKELHAVTLSYLRKHDIYHWAEKFLAISIPGETTYPVPLTGTVHKKTKAQKDYYQ